MSMGWLWILWLLGVVISFAFLEAYTLKYPERHWTLSRFMAELGSRWPLTLFLSGLLVGGLATHFFGASWNCGGTGMPH